MPNLGFEGSPGNFPIGQFPTPETDLQKRVREEFHEKQKIVEPDMTPDEDGLPKHVGDRIKKDKGEMQKYFDDRDGMNERLRARAEAEKAAVYERHGDFINEIVGKITENIESLDVRSQKEILNEIHSVVVQKLNGLHEIKS